MPNNSSGADVEMPDLGVAHETFRKTDVEAVRVDLRPVPGAELIHDLSNGCQQ